MSFLGWIKSLFSANVEIEATAEEISEDNYQLSRDKAAIATLLEQTKQAKLEAEIALCNTSTSGCFGRISEADLKAGIAEFEEKVAKVFSTERLADLNGVRFGSGDIAKLAAKQYRKAFDNKEQFDIDEYGWWIDPKPKRPVPLVAAKPIKDKPSKATAKPKKAKKK